MTMVAVRKNTYALILTLIISALLLVGVMYGRQHTLNQPYHGVAKGKCIPYHCSKAI